MRTRLTPHFIDLTYEALLCSFWRKEALKRFLRRCDVPEALVSSFGDETKRAFLDRALDQINRSTQREEAFAKLAKALIDQTSFPDLKDWEDEADKLAKAESAVKALRAYVEQQDKEIENEEARRRYNESQAKAARAQQNLEQLASRLNQLVPELGTQAGGYKFQDWFYDVMGYFDVVSKKPYVSDGRQVDGSVTLKDTTFLVELKFTKDPAGAPDIDTFIRKVETKADNTMGLFISMSGFSSEAKKEPTKGATKILLLDYSHIYHVLGVQMSFPDLVDRLKRHASQTGQAFLAPRDFG